MPGVKHADGSVCYTESMAVSSRPATSFLGPGLVILGTSMWGLETYWRKELSPAPFSASALVFHEHWTGLLFTAPFIFLGYRQLRSAPTRAWLSIILSGVLGSALGAVCFTKALNLMNASVANLLLNVQPVVSVMVTWFWLGERPRASFYPWALVALGCGVAMAFDPTSLTAPEHLAEGLFYVGATALCWGASTTFGRGAMLHFDFRTAAGLRYVIGLASLTTVILIRGQTSELHFEALHNGARAWSLACLVVVSGVTPTFIYFAGLARSKASVATFAEMAQTFASLLITWRVLGYALTPLQIVAGLLLLVTVWFINRTVDDQPATAPAAQPGLTDG